MESDEQLKPWRRRAHIPIEALTIYMEEDEIKSLGDLLDQSGEPLCLENKDCIRSQLVAEWLGLT